MTLSWSFPLHKGSDRCLCLFDNHWRKTWREREPDTPALKQCDTIVCDWTHCMKKKACSISFFTKWEIFPLLQSWRTKFKTTVSQRRESGFKNCRALGKHGRGVALMSRLSLLVNALTYWIMLFIIWFPDLTSIWWWFTAERFKITRWRAEHWLENTFVKARLHSIL